ncbi:MAG: pyridoxal-phosphate dependent enzyme, partial [Mycobacteriales bacterium]
LELVDGDFDAARERAAAIAQQHGIRLVEDSLDIETCEGAATIGLELVDALPSFDTVLIALGGGALATGVGHVIKAQAPEVEVICVQPLGAPAMTLSWRQWRVVTTDSTNTIADGVAGRVPFPPSWTTSSWSLMTPSWSRKRRSSPVCGCSWTTLASSWNRRPRSALRRSSKTVTASPADTWPPSCAAATSTWTPTTAGLVRLPPYEDDRRAEQATKTPHHSIVKISHPQVLTISPTRGPDAPTRLGVRSRGQNPVSSATTGLGVNTATRGSGLVYTQLRLAA